jgi:hypothetical protein
MQRINDMNDMLNNMINHGMDPGQREPWRDNSGNFKLDKALEAYCKLSSYKVFEEEVCIEQQVLQIEQQIVSEDIIVEGIL